MSTRKSTKSFFLVVFLIFTLLNLVSCNLFKDFANPHEKSAMIEEAKMLIDAAKYIEAADILDILLIQYPDDSEVATLRSSAYTGAAGIGIFDVGFNIAELPTTTNIAEKPFTSYFVLVQAPNNIEIEYALEARNSMLNFSSDASLRTNEMNMYLIVLSYGVVATIISARADINPNNNETDNTFSCSSISDNDVLEIIFTYATAKNSMLYADGSTLWQGIEKSVKTFTTALEALSINLSISNKNEISNAECSIMKNFLVGGLKGIDEACTCNL